MPIFEYHCKACNQTVEKIQRQPQPTAAHATLRQAAALPEAEQKGRRDSSTHHKHTKERYMLTFTDKARDIIKQLLTHEENQGKYLRVIFEGFG